MANPGGNSPKSKTPEDIKILVIEDNFDDQMLLAHQLRKVNLDRRVRFISNGLQALKVIERNPDLWESGLVAIFLDLNLPGISGVELLRRLRQQQGAESFPVIVMTSSNEPSDLKACQKLNVTNFVQKPVTFLSFSHAIANLFHPSNQLHSVRLRENSGKS